MTRDARHAAPESARPGQTITGTRPLDGGPFRDRFGICQWFHYEDRDSVLQAVDLLHELGIRHVRTGISWADDYRPKGHAWYDWMMQQLEPFDVLLSVWHTPPSMSENSRCNGPPERLEDYADYMEWLAVRYGDSVQDFELWNEPNNRLKWDFLASDPGWAKFARMIGLAAERLQERDKRTVLGGIIPVDAHWLRMMERRGALEHIDVVSIHGFPEMWWEHHPNWDWYRDWHGWPEKIDKASAAAGGRPVWITETGLATVDLETSRPARHQLQQKMLELAAESTAERTYWYSLIDLAPSREAIEGFHVDENEYHLGLVDAKGKQKPAFSVLKQMLRRT